MGDNEHKESAISMVPPRSQRHPNSIETPFPSMSSMFTTEVEEMVTSTDWMILDGILDDINRLDDLEKSGKSSGGTNGKSNGKSDDEVEAMTPSPKYNLRVSLAESTVSPRAAFSPYS